jgi:hypothetical protein
MDTTTEYLVDQTTKVVGDLLKELDDMRDDIIKINMSIVAERSEDSLVLMHENLTTLRDNISKSRLLTLIAATLSEVATDGD